MNSLPENEYYPDVLRAEIEKFERESMVASALTAPVSRRGFMKASAVVGGGMLLAFNLAGSEKADAQAAGGGRPGGGGFGGGQQALNPGAYVKIAPDGKITFY